MSIVFMENIQIFLLLAFFIPAILFLLTQYKTLTLIKPANRTIRPGLVWAQLVPGLNLVLQFVVVAGISNSIVKEANATDADSILGVSSITLENGGSKPTYKIGMAYCLLWTLSIVINLSGKMSGIKSDFIGPILSVSAMICWIIYWVELSKFKRKLKMESF